MEVVTWHGRIKESQEIILTTKWWENLRYHNFGTGFVGKLQANPNLKTELR